MYLLMIDEWTEKVYYEDAKSLKEAEEHKHVRQNIGLTGVNGTTNRAVAVTCVTGIINFVVVGEQIATWMESQTVIFHHRSRVGIKMWFVKISEIYSSAAKTLMVLSFKWLVQTSQMYHFFSILAIF